MEQEMSPKYEAQLRSEVRFVERSAKPGELENTEANTKVWQDEYKGIGSNSDYLLFDEDGNVKDWELSTHPESPEYLIITDEIRRQYESKFPGKTLNEDLSASVDKK